MIVRVQPHYQILTTREILRELKKFKIIIRVPLRVI